jgi:hypothetical protein
MNAIINPVYLGSVLPRERKSLQSSMTHVQFHFTNIRRDRSFILVIFKYIGFSPHDVVSK